MLCGGLIGNMSRTRLLVTWVARLRSSPRSCWSLLTALADRSFSTEFATNDTGSIAITGNTLETCPMSAANCAAAKVASPFTATDAYDNNSFSMVYLSADAGTIDGASTFDSSSATVSLPADATVLFAGLYWGADPSAGAGVTGQPTPAGALGYTRCTTVGFKVPGSSSYTSITASKLDVSGLAPLQTGLLEDDAIRRVRQCHRPRRGGRLGQLQRRQRTGRDW